MKKKVFRVIAGIMFLISPILALFQNANMMPDSWSGSLGFALSMGAAILLAVGLFLDKFLPSAIGTALYCSMVFINILSFAGLMTQQTGNITGRLFPLLIRNLFLLLFWILLMISILVRKRHGLFAICATAAWFIGFLFFFIYEGKAGHTDVYFMVEYLILGCEAALGALFSGLADFGRGEVSEERN